MGGNCRLGKYDRLLVINDVIFTILNFLRLWTFYGSYWKRC